MVFVDSVDQLEYYFPNPQWGCYGDHVFNPYDILLQANGFTLTGGYGITISVCDTAGSIQQDGTANFDSWLGTFVISGTTYYFVNIRCNEYTSYMLSNRCFALNVQITDTSNGTIVFNKWTQKYELDSSAVVAVTAVSLDGVPLIECVPAARGANCGINYIKFLSQFDCIDSFNGDYYGTATPITGIGDFPFSFARFSWIEGRIRKVPNEIKRTISINCRTQKSETTPKYLMTGGNITFPVWKVEEIEQMLLANRLFVNDEEYQSEGGTPFEQFGRPYNCQYRYKLSISMQKCLSWQIFGCKPNCDDLATYYAFPKEFSKVYNDQQQLIAVDVDSLKIYFQSQTGYKSAENLPFVPPCPMYAMFEVQSSGVLPKYLYVDNLAPASRIFPQQLPINTLDFTPLCNGVNNYNQVPQSVVTGYVTELIQVPVAEVTGYSSQNVNAYTLQITPDKDWVLDNTVTSAVTADGEVSLNISASTDVFTSPVSGRTLGIISYRGRPMNTRIITDNPNMPFGAQLVIYTNGVIEYTGNATKSVDPDIFVELFQIRYNIYG